MRGGKELIELADMNNSVPHSLQYIQESNILCSGYAGERRLAKCMRVHTSCHSTSSGTLLHRGVNPHDTRTLRCARIGKMKAAVLPEPVGAQARTSRFYKERGTITDIRYRNSGRCGGGMWVVCVKSVSGGRVVWLCACGCDI